MDIITGFILFVVVGFIIAYMWDMHDIKNGKIPEFHNTPTTRIIEKETIVYKKPKLSSREKRKIKKELEKAARERDLDNMLEAMAILDDDEDW